MSCCSLTLKDQLWMITSKMHIPPPPPLQKGFITNSKVDNSSAHLVSLV